MSASANVLTIARSRSGLAAARLSSARACRGRLSGAVIVLISFEASTLRRSAGGRSRIGSNPYTTSLDATRVPHRILFLFLKCPYDVRRLKRE
jgi:hypothetical protein